MPILFFMVTDIAHSGGIQSKPKKIFDSSELRNDNIEELASQQYLQIFYQWIRDHKGMIESIRSKILENDTTGFRYSYTKPKSEGKDLPYS